MTKCYFLHPVYSLLAMLIFFTSCSGQNASKATKSNLNKSSAIATGDTVKVLGDSLWIVFQDRKNNYWFGTNGHGVYRYDGKNSIHFTTKDGLCSNKIWKIEEDKPGNIYFTTVEGGISRFDGQSFSTLSITGNSNNQWKLEPGDLWFKGPQDSGVVYRYDGKYLHRLKFPKTKQGEEFIAKYPRSKYPAMTFNPYDVYSIYRDHKANVWFGMATLGVCRYDGKSFAWISEDDVTELDDGASNGVRSIIEDKEGYFWFSNTVYRYTIYEDGKDKSVMNYRKEKGIGSLDGRKDGNLDFYLSIAKDNNDELWIATYTDGVWRYDGKNITHYPVKDGNKTILLFTVYKDNQGNLWLGSQEAGAYKFNGKTFEKFRP